MKVKAEEIDINEEYEKLVPPSERKSLFDESEDYESLREYIMAQPYNSLKKNKLPFDGVKLMDYVDFRFNEAVDKATEEHKHLFFIRQSQKGNPDFCNAAGYYQKYSKSFVVLEYSFIVADAYGSVPYPSQRKGNENLQGNNRYITSSLYLASPDLAATFVLGQKAGLDEWVDRRGKGLLEYYPELATKPAPKPVTEAISPVATTTPVIRHIFQIVVKGVCNAKGYFDPEKGHFFILKDSLLALKSDPEYEKSASGMARNRMIASVCTFNAHYYIVGKDTKCRSASAAASYVLGKNSSYIEWEDEQGRGLKDFFPDRFYQKKTLFEKLADYAKKSVSPAPAPVEDGPAHLFFIKKNAEPNRECDAQGYYDKVTKKFVLLSGSTWSWKVTKSYQYSASEIMRRSVIQKNCKLILGTYKQFRDVLCDSPSQAASYVIGRSANGWEEWVDKDGRTLKEVFRDTDEEESQKKN